MGWGFSFQLSDTPGYTELTALFDLYKITLVEVIWECTSVSANVSGNTSCYPTLLAYPDADDATAPTSLSVVDQVQRMERLQFSATRNQFKRSIVPRVTNSTNTTGGTNNYAVSMASPFLDCASPSVIHYGVKFWLKNYNTSFDNAVNLSLRYHITTRDAR